MRKVLLSFFLLGVSSGFAQTPVIQAVLNAADYSPRIAPGVWVAIFGNNLAPSEAIQTTLPLPTQLGGVLVSVKRAQTQTQIPLRYVSPGQINALLPFDAGTGYLQFTVTTSGGASAQFEVYSAAVAPAIYTKNALGNGEALAFDSGFQPVTKIGSDAIVLYASGLGATNPPGTAEGGNTSEPFNRLVTIPTVRIGGKTAQVAFGGLAPYLPGVYQLNVVPPAGPLADNTLALSFRVSASDIMAAATTLPVASGLNTANRTGGISSTYPLSSTVLDFSPLLLSAKFNVAVDIVPGARSFNIVAACQARVMSIVVDPVAGTWQATSNVPAAAERTGNFVSALDVNGASFGTIADFRNGGLQFPNNIIPLSRLSPAEVQAVGAIPLPNSAASASVNFVTAGVIPSNGHFVIDDSNNSTVTNFGGFIKALASNVTGQQYRTNPCTLTVDGVLVASTYTTFK